MKVAFYTLGCKVNLYETEVMMSKFKEKGYSLVEFKEYADIYVINSCTVTNNADIKTRKTINHIKNNYPNSTLALVGCYSQVNKEINIDGIDIIIGTSNKSKIVELVEDYIKNKKQIYKIEDIYKCNFENMSIDNFNTKTRAFVKIQDGCNNYCSYCIIPYARGNIRSKDMDDIINEVTKLVHNGYKEIVLTGIHTGHYGKEKGINDLSDVLINLSKIDNLKRIRLSSIEITEIDDKFLKCLKDIDIIAEHLHIPIQSGCNKTLKDMLRKYDVNYFKNKIDVIRQIRPDISITTDVIVGFPNETDEDFNETVSTIRDINFSKLHVFPYSKRNGTKAALMQNQIDSITKRKRSKILIDLSNELENNYKNKFINKKAIIIPETYKDGYLIGHSSNYLLIKEKGNIEEINKLKEIMLLNINNIL
ncbi:MAG: tRNA (N(6)-L-threonylcarbamoyladenosine(37)-C(2))-methylthiotransferase MtaB [Tenericutes bacterium]|nr:tRNA (N(6)-L-threonylcarbamoyladenosine(37)-C(2))-methylthiotransferase MtaB [Mycoplasmatota bacterium]